MDREAVGTVAEMKDAAETEGARRATGVSAGAGGAPDPEVVAKPKRRRFTAEYRLKILRQADACKAPGELGASDPEFEAKMADVVGLYLDPPERALVLCVDEKSQIQALNRTQPILPLRPGLPARMTHDYKRNGTTSLFAALEVASGRVLGRCFPRHTHVEF